MFDFNYKNSYMQIPMCEVCKDFNHSSNIIMIVLLEPLIKTPSSPLEPNWLSFDLVLDSNNP
jgi:hypothetical protein